MKSNKRAGLFLCAGLFTVALLSGCGNSGNTGVIPAVESIFYAHTAVLFGNHSTLYTTGYNGFGQLGNGTLTSQAVMAPISVPGKVNRFALGADHTMAFAFANVSSIYVWGANLHGQLGSTAIPITGTTAYQASPLKLPLHGHVTEIAAGGLHSLAVVDGKVQSWGYNGLGQLGDLTRTDRAVPVPVIDQLNGVALPATKVAAGGDFSIALSPVGTVYGWGNNFYGQAGVDPTAINAAAVTVSPTLVSFRNFSSITPVGPLTGVTQIAAGGSTAYALTGDGKVWAWGYNGQGRLGLNPADPANVSSAAAVQVRIPASFLPNNATVIKISAGLRHVLALLSNNTVLAWGFNEFAQLGNNSVIDTFPFQGNILANTFVPAQVLDATSAVMAGVTDIFAFGNASMALSGGVWYGWGDNGFGQLGNPVDTTAVAYKLKPVKVLGP